MTYRLHLQQLVGRTFRYNRDDINKAITHVRHHVHGLEVNGPFEASHMVTALVESHMDEDMFREWTLHTSKIKKMPKAMSFTVHDQTKCPVCGAKSHSIYQCPSFREQSVEFRQSTVQRLKMCQNCLSTRHFSRACSSYKSCRECSKRHHTLLHRPDMVLSAPAVFPQPTNVAAEGVCSASGRCVLRNWRKNLYRLDDMHGHSCGRRTATEGLCSGGQRLDHLLHNETSCQSTGCQADSKWNRSHRFWKDTKSKQ